MQRAVEEQRREQRVAQGASVRYETEPGAQMQIDFGEKWVAIAGGVTRTMRGDNAKALVLGRDRATGVVTFHPAYLAFCRD